MKYAMIAAGAVALLVLTVADRALAQNKNYSGVNPPGYERRSMGNLPGAYEAQSRPATPRYRPYSYGNPPYYTRPPVTPYYVVPQPYYWGYPTYVPPSYYGFGPYGGYRTPYGRW